MKPALYFGVNRFWGMSENIAVLFANEAFYLAFAGSDFEAMDELWSRESPVTCIHPGWNLLSGRDDVMESWEAILANPDATKIKYRNATATLFGELALVTCHEELEQGFLIATNIFIREDGAWKMIHHQAGASPIPPEEEEPEFPDTMQ